MNELSKQKLKRYTKMKVLKDFVEKKYKKGTLFKISDLRFDNEGDPLLNFKSAYVPESNSVAAVSLTGIMAFKKGKIYIYEQKVLTKEENYINSKIDQLSYITLMTYKEDGETLIFSKEKRIGISNEKKLISSKEELIESFKKDRLELEKLFHIQKKKNLK